MLGPFFANYITQVQTSKYWTVKSLSGGVLQQENTGTLCNDLATEKLHLLASFSDQIPHLY